jgi:GNAT superfamily N-acetyltransferase
MLVNENNIVCRQLTVNDFENLSKYLDQLNSESRKRFGPHSFDISTIIDIYTQSDSHIGYITVEEKSSKIIAYAIILKGYLEHDNQRLQSYGIMPEHLTDCTYAPSVADNWQGRGIGTALFQFILGDLQKTSFRRIILWGGVHTDNERAVRYYQHNGFTILGEFQHNGNNFDMIYNYRLK